MGKRIDVVYMDDWQGLYLDDKLLDEGHSLDLWDTLKRLQHISFELGDRIEAYNSGYSSLPAHLDDLVRD